MPRSLRPADNLWGLPVARRPKRGSAISEATVRSARGSVVGPIEMIALGAGFTASQFATAVFGTSMKLSVPGPTRSTTHEAPLLRRTRKTSVSPARAVVLFESEKDDVWT